VSCMCRQSGAAGSSSLAALVLTGMVLALRRRR